MSGNGIVDPHPFRVSFDRRQLADALARALGDTNVRVDAEDGSWIVSIDGAKTDRLVVRVLDATRDALTGEPTASATVQIDGREYVMHALDHSPAA